MHTNETQYYELPQYVGSDIINPLVDTNGAYQKIDTTLHDIAEEAGQGTTDIANLKSKVGNASLDTTAQDLSGAVNELNDELDNASTGVKARLDAVEGDVDTLQSQMVTAQGNITDLQNNKASASDVSALQSAMSTAQGDITDLQSDVTDLETNKANASDLGAYQIVNAYTVSVTADGTKTVRELLDELHSAFITYKNNINDNERIDVDTIGAPAMAISKTRGFISKTTTIGNIVGIDVASTATAGVFTITSCLEANSNQETIRVEASGVTITNHNSDVPNVGTNFTIRGHLYKVI